MRSKQKNSKKVPADRVVKDIRRATRKQYSAEEKIRIVLEPVELGLPVADLIRQMGITEQTY